MITAVGTLCGFMVVTGLGGAAGYLRLGLAGAGLMLLTLATWDRTARAAVALMICVVFADATIGAHAWWRLVAADEVVEPGNEVAAYLSTLPGLGRVYSPSYSIPQQTAWYHGLETAHGMDPTQLRLYRDFMASAGGYDDPEYTVPIPPFAADDPAESALRGGAPSARLLGLLNVTHLAAAFTVDSNGWELIERVAGVYVYRNTEAMPRAWLVHETEALGDGDTLRRLGDMDLGSQALIAPGWAEPSVAPGGDGTADAVRIIERSPNALDLEVQASAPGAVVISEVWYPGWRAWVDGRAAPVVRADFVLRAVPIGEAGRHIVRLEYTPVWLHRGAVVSVAAFLAYCIMVACRGKR
jgi:hypothetical protein